MPLSWNEIKNRAAAFVVEWRDETNEHAEAKSFWDQFFHIFGLSRRRLAQFEAAVKKASGKQGFIDLFWPEVLLVEHKSRGKDLTRAHEQAFDYFPGIAEKDLPRYVLVSDFARFRLHDLDTGEEVEFPLSDLVANVNLFGFIAGYEKRRYDAQDPVNVHAAEKMGALHDRLREAGYGGHDLEVYLVRLLFCLFADDTGLFERGAFQAYIEGRTREDGSDLGGALASIFQVLNTPPEKRQRTLDEERAAFPYVNGALFAETLPLCEFDASMRGGLLDACSLDWGAISPAIFGGLFQSVMDAERRRNLGAHYTSEQNIQKLIRPLFMDGLRAEFDRLKTNRKALSAFHEKLARLHLLDPACGCGNFLVIAYRELRLLELDVLLSLYGGGQQVLDVADLIRVNVDQCFGIEIEEFPAQIAQVALWLMDHQMNLKVAEAFGQYFTRLPLRQSAHIKHGNALRLDWNACFGDDQPEQFDYLLGNPPFVGKQYQTAEQKADLSAVMQGVSGAGVLDFVTAWYVKAAQYMEQHPETRTAFVSTNSISQGEQVGILWSELFGRYGAKIHFAHRTFIWTSEGTGAAAVHVVIIGFGVREAERVRLFEYDDGRGEPHERTVKNINPYLVEGGDVVIAKRREPLVAVPPINFGSMPNDGGFLLLSPEERAELLAKEPAAGKYLRPLMGSREFINNEERFCLWLLGADPRELRSLPMVMQRVEAVREQRELSPRATTRELASTPTLFGEIRQADTRYLAVPEVSSERRRFIPVGFLPAKVIATNKLYMLPGATLLHFGVLSSSMHMAWVRHVAGRMKSDYSYSAGIVYNNFPWPEPPNEKTRADVERAAQAVLDARQPHLDKGATLADLYDPLTMPSELVKAHAALDRAVDRLYRPQPFPNEAGRVAFLFERYEALTAPLTATAKPGRRKKQT